MENIGKLLKEKRLELGLTVEQISEKTRLTTKHIKALEEGEINFFKDDLSYLRFFVKSYCEAVDIDFETVKDELRSSVNDYTMAFTNTVTMEHEEMEKHIAATELSRVSKTGEDKKKSPKKKIKKAKAMKKPDFSLVSLVAVIGVVAIVLMLAFVVYLNTGKDDGNTTPVKPPVAGQQEGETPKPQEEETPPEKKELVITKNDTTHYIVTGYNEGDELTFGTQLIGANTAYSVTVDGTVLNEPVAQVYYAKDHSEKPIEAKVKAKKGMKVQLYFGYFNNIVIKINEQTAKIDDSIQSSGGSYTLEFTLE